MDSPIVFLHGRDAKFGARKMKYRLSRPVGDICELDPISEANGTSVSIIGIFGSPNMSVD